MNGKKNKIKTETLARKDVKGLITKPLTAVKGDSGSVLIIIGSDTHIGAGYLSGMAALRSGADIVGIAAPERVAITINSMISDLITHKLPGKTLGHSHISTIKQLMDKYDSILIGPGGELSDGVIEEVISYAKEKKKKLVLDANAAIQNINELKNTAILLNHTEYKRFIKKNKLNVEIEIDEKKPKEQLENEQLNKEQEKILFTIKDNCLISKNNIDKIFYNNTVFLSTGGSLRATVAGTGDIIAGLTAGFRAQKVSIEKAVILASITGKRVAEILEGKKHFSFLASEYLRQIPEVLKELKIFRVVKHI